MDRMAGMELTRMPTVGSTTDQSIGTAMAQVVSGLTRSAGRKARRIHEVTTALQKQISVRNLCSKGTGKHTTDQPAV